jgi:hypothetical protein
METKREKIIILIIIAGAIAVLGSILVMQSLHDDGGLNGLLSGTPRIVLNTELPKGSSEMPVYRVLDEDIYEYGSLSFNSIHNPPTDEEAIHMAYDFLTSNDVLPDDAVFNKIYTSHKSTISNESVTEKIPVLINVKFSREIETYPVVGPGDFIEIYISSHHEDITEVVCCWKNWRVIEYVNDTKIMDAEEAYQKLSKGETIESTPLSSYQETFDINEVFLGYYSNVPSEPQEYYEPVWVFSGSIGDNSNIKFSVNACK